MSNTRNQDRSRRGIRQQDIVSQSCDHFCKRMLVQSRRRREPLQDTLCCTSEVGKPTSCEVFRSAVMQAIIQSVNVNDFKNHSLDAKSITKDNTFCSQCSCSRLLDLICF